MLSDAPIDDMSEEDIDWLLEELTFEEETGISRFPPTLACGVYAAVDALSHLHKAEPTYGAAHIEAMARILWNRRCEVYPRPELLDLNRRHRGLSGEDIAWLLTPDLLVAKSTLTIDAYGEPPFELHGWAENAGPTLRYLPGHWVNSVHDGPQHFSRDPVMLPPQPQQPPAAPQSAAVDEPSPAASEAPPNPAPEAPAALAATPAPPRPLSSSATTATDIETAFRNFRVPGPGKATRLPFDTWKTYRVTGKRAKTYASDLKNGFTGMLLRKPPHPQERTGHKWDSLVDHYRGRDVRLIYMPGYNGCGKSYPTQSLLNAHPAIYGQAKISVPTNHLRKEWCEALTCEESETYRVGTFETVLLKTAKLLIVDEFIVLPSGYVDLACILDPAITHVVLLGDPTQLPARELDAEARWPSIQTEAARFRPFADYYCLWTRRSPQAVAKRLGVKSLNRTVGQITRNVKFMKGPQIHMATIDADFASVTCPDPKTAASVQGLTYDQVVNISLDHNLAKHGGKYLVNMLVNRSRAGLHFFGASSARVDEALEHQPFLRDFLAGKRVDIRRHFADELKGMRIITSPLLA